MPDRNSGRGGLLAYFHGGGFVAAVGASVTDSEGFYLTEAELKWYKRHYVTEEADTLHPRCSPLLADDLSSIPPA